MGWDSGARFARPNSKQFIEHLQFRNRQLRKLRYLPETENIVAAMTDSPVRSSSKYKAINDLIATGINDGWWPKLSGFYVLAARDKQAASVDWVNPSGVKLLEVGTLTFTQNSGYQSDGTTGYLDTQKTLNALGSKYTQNDAHAGVLIRANSSITINGMGLASGTGIRITRPSGNNLQTAINTSTATLSTGTFPLVKNIVANRKTSSDYDQYADGTLAQNVAVASSALAANAVVLLRYQTNYSNSLALLRAAHFGASLSAAEILSINSALAQYMASIGASA